MKNNSGKEDSMQALVGNVWADVAVHNNPYFVGLADGSLSKDDFVETQIQFYYAVVFFSRPMGVVAAKIPSPRLRLEILRNVWEEHGEGQLAKSHGQTFQQFLQRLAEVSLSEIESRALWPATRAFNTTLTGVAVSDDWEVSTACFGMIERMFASISAWIGQGVVQRGWLRAEDMVHYNLHEELDIKHSEDFFTVLREGLEDAPQRMYCVEQGLRMGAYIFDQFYRGLYQARACRRESGVERPQAHIYQS